MQGMTALAPYEVDMDPRRTPVDVEIVVPVYNEAPQLAERIIALRTFLDESFPFRAVVTIVDNASTDDTYAVATALTDSLSGVAALHLDRKGRGFALREAWSTSSAPVVAYMDVDLSTSLEALLPLVAPLLSGHRDVTIGSRLAHGARVVRGPKRELISRSYNLILRVTLRGRFSDAQCGFKALRRDAAERILPLVEDNQWFFDTELLVVAEGSACASVRCRWTGSMTPIRASTSCRPPPMTYAASGACSCAGPRRTLRPSPRVPARSRRISCCASRASD